MITTPTCPLRPLVRARPDLTELDRAVWASLVSSALVDTEPNDVVCETRNCHTDNADCRVAVAVRARH